VTYILYGEGCTDDTPTPGFRATAMIHSVRKFCTASDVAEVTAKILLYPTDHVAKIIELT
jgi:hypothetical protein